MALPVHCKTDTSGQAVRELASSLVQRLYVCAATAVNSRCAWRAPISEQWRVFSCQLEALGTDYSYQLAQRGKLENGVNCGGVIGWARQPSEACFRTLRGTNFRKPKMENNSEAAKVGLKQKGLL